MGEEPISASIARRRMNENINKKGKLYVVATPIGNMQDITQRAIDVLSRVDLIAAEDTRICKKMLSILGISAEVISFFEHNQLSRIDYIMDRLKMGKDVALTCDAGTPGISDPGYLLAREARLEGFEIIPIPGASSITAALSVSGIDCNRFSFLGFLPVKKKQREAIYQQVAESQLPTVLFIPPHDFAKTIEELDEYMESQREVFYARELTKLHEETRLSSFEELKELTRKPPKGEIIIIISGCQSDKETKRDKLLHLSTAEHLVSLKKRENLSMKEAVKRVATARGLPRNEVYQIALSLERKDD